MPYEYYNRYQTKGKQLRFLPDSVHHSQIDWMLNDITWQDNGREMLVTSPIYKDGNITMCRGLSFSRAAEWMLLDSLRK